MAAGLNLLPRQRFELILSDGSIIPGQFGTQSTALFGQRKNFTLSEIYKNFVIEQKDEQGNVAYDVRLHDIIEFILCACESAARLKGERFNFTSSQLCQWVDDYTFDTGIPNVLITLYGHSVAQAKDEKKNQEQPATT
jgi:hypothetical protein